MKHLATYCLKRSGSMHRYPPLTTASAPSSVSAPPRLAPATNLEIVTAAPLAPPPPTTSLPLSLRACCAPLQAALLSSERNPARTNPSTVNSDGCGTTLPEPGFRRFALGHGLDAKVALHAVLRRGDDLCRGNRLGVRAPRPIFFVFFNESMKAGRLPTGAKNLFGECECFFKLSAEVVGDLLPAPGVFDVLKSGLGFSRHSPWLSIGTSEQANLFCLSNTS
jgi:hypothetical protein